MLKKVLVLDKSGMAPTVARRLESELDCNVEITRESSYAKSFLESNGASLTIVNLYFEQGGIVESNVDFVKNYLREKNIPVIIFSRAKVETIAGRTGLNLGIDYQAYLRKPSSPQQFVECVRGILGID